MGKRIITQVYNAKKYFPISGKGFVVQRVKMPTRNRGSQVVSSKTFKTMIAAKKYAKKRYG